MRHATGDRRITCNQTSFWGTADAAQQAPSGLQSTPLVLQGPRADYFSGFVFSITAQATAGAGDDDVFVPLPVGRTDRLYDTLVGADPSANVRIVDAAEASGATELGGILGIFRWGSAFAAAAGLLACLISLVALLLDRQAGNSYLQVVGLTRQRTAMVAVAEVMTAALSATAAGLVGSYFWARTFHGDSGSASLVIIAIPFLAALIMLAVLATALTVLVLGSQQASVVPDRDGLVGSHDAATM